MKLAGMIPIGIEWFVNGTGKGASTHMETGGFTKSRPDLPHPDIQWHFLPGLVEAHGRSAGTFHAFQVHIGTLRALSRGSVHIRDKKPESDPIIQPNYLSEKQDLIDLRACLDQARDVMGQSSMDSYRGEELTMSMTGTTIRDIDNFIRNNSESAYHPSCTAKMGPVEDPMAVVNPLNMDVYGVDGLKVVDASVMPSIVSGNLNGPVIMMAERAADLIM
eukprot:GHVN01023908.1.p1 GENE.GHVN01023908.1~~GHVN01023908.1.p1  ORF type:complete len:219 (-),score=25.02 GHVN01023908.1:241-897(-)